MSRSKVVPTEYVEREQALIKHLLLKGYLEKLFLIIGSSGARELCYVDCFAGPWDVEDDALGSTSIAISLQILAKCRTALARQGRSPKIRALFVEKDAKSYRRLGDLLATSTPEGIESTSLHGDFLSLRDEILKWCGSRSFCFFFVDPTGWSPVTIEHLQPLLRRRDSEFLITFMYDWINRTASMAEWQGRVRGLLGELPNLEGLPPIERERAILGMYRKNLCREMVSLPPSKALSAYVRVLDPKKERTKYHLVYLTRHPLGIIQFMTFSESVHIVQRQYRAAKQDERRTKKTRTPDMFGPQTYMDSGKAKSDPEEMERFWLERIGPTGRQFGEPEFAAILEETNWFPTDLQAALGRLIAQRLVRNRDAKKARPKRPLHWEGRGEFLEPVSPSL
jgi:three-Cys-motif partner protein